MKNFILNWVVAQQVKRDTLKTDHICEDCGHVALSVRRVSTLYLLGYILAGVALGYFLSWLLGVVLTLICMFVNANLAKPQCRKCFSHNIRVAKDEEKAHARSIE